MAKGTKRLTPGHLRKKGPAKLCDGGGLWLYISKANARSWVFRYRFQGKDYEIGLGGLSELAPGDARKTADEYRQAKKQGINPVDYRRKLEAQATSTFNEIAEKFVSIKQDEWINQKHIQQWRNTLKTYASPILGDMPVDEIEIGHILAVLEPIWLTKTETASRVQGRIAKVLSYAIAAKLRPGPNPAAWKDNLDALLPSPNKVKGDKHFAAMPYTDVPTFIDKLKQRDAISAKALLFTILTAVRTGGVIGAKWEEIDFDSKGWTVPAERMKGQKNKRKPHTVPLSDQAIELLKSLPGYPSREIDPQGWLFPSPQYGKHISQDTMRKYLQIHMKQTGLTTHGFRSSFKDWAVEVSTFPEMLSEAALAHTIANKARAAYERGDKLEKRRKLMQSWADFCHLKNASSKVTHIREPNEAHR